MPFDLRVDPPEKCHMVYSCVMTRNHPKVTWRWYVNVTISRGFRLNHLNGSSDSIERWENTILILLMHSDETFSMFTLCHLVLRRTFQSLKTHVRVSSKVMFLWWVKPLTLYEVGIYHNFHLLELELELHRGSTAGLHFCCTCVSVLVFLLSTLSVESWFIYVTVLIH